MNDLLIKDAQLFDGLGNPSKSADVLINDGKIVRIGKITESAKTIVNAHGLALMPGS